MSEVNNGAPSAGAGTGGGSTTILESGSSSAPQDWRSSIGDDEIKSHPSLKDFKDVTSLAKSYVNQGKLIGTARLEAPNEKWTDQQWGDFYGKLGRPENPEGYKFDRPPLPDGKKYDEGLIKDALSVFHKSGFTNKQTTEVLNWYISKGMEKDAADVTKKDEFRQLSETALKKELGGEYDSTINKAKVAAQVVGGEDFVKSLVESGQANDPTMIKFLAKIESFIREDKAGVASGQGFVSGSDSAHSEINALRSDKAFMDIYMNPSAPGYEDARQRLQRLYQIKNQK